MLGVRDEIDPSHLSILIIEENHDVASKMEWWLQNFSQMQDSRALNIVSKSNLRDGVSYLKSNHVDLCFVQLMMADSWGPRGLDYLRDRFRGVEIFPMVPMTSHAILCELMDRGIQSVIETDCIACEEDIVDCDKCRKLKRQRSLKLLKRIGMLVPVLV